LQDNSLGSITRRYKGIIVKIVNEGENVKSFYVRTSGLPWVIPGQFVMVWLPGFEEIPLSPSMCENNMLRLTIAAVGKTTQAFHRLKVGSLIVIRGPYGKGFTLTYRHPLLIGGGYGIAPLVHYVRTVVNMGSKPEIAIGGRSRSHLYHIEELLNLNIKVYPYTEDGSYGVKGLVTDVLDHVNVREYDAILACGPEKMLYKVYEKLKGKEIPVELSLERYIKCGIGLCGSCSLGGLLICKEGPVFSIDKLEGTEFGLWRRDESGGKIPIDG